MPDVNMYCHIFHLELKYGEEKKTLQTELRIVQVLQMVYAITITVSQKLYKMEGG